MFKYKCYLCGQIVFLKQNLKFVKYYCESRNSWTKLYRIK